AVSLAAQRRRRLERRQLSRDDRGAGRTNEDPATPRQGGCEVDLRTEETNRLQRRNGFSALRTSHGALESVHGVGVAHRGSLWKGEGRQPGGYGRSGLGSGLQQHRSNLAYEHLRREGLLQELSD